LHGCDSSQREDALGSSTPVVGAKEIDLRFSPGAPAARLSADSPPVFPSIPAGDIAGIIRQVSDVTAKLDALPLSQIVGNVRDATQRLDQFSASPELRQTLQRLNQSVSNIDEVTQQGRKQVGPLLAQLWQAAVQAQAAVRSVHGLVGGDGGVVGGGAEQSDLPHALYELTRAARSLRELADLLQRQPDAVVFGKATKP
jgi:paraquat-inducible protein B